ncbi:regulator of chromosome condensation 1/beta-lactamase-inhibitor protein II [Xylariaceae sp. FL0255]|nr:regulator of chromosome condensation 1/beta-lactamase-inhibitor protein II [Xylariaceae sp. FL0255]
MGLYVAGFNAWRQLEFSSAGDGKGKSSEEPSDVRVFQRVLEDSPIEVLYASLSCTLVRTPAGLQYAGFPDKSLKTEQHKDKLLSSTAATAGNGFISIYDGVGTVVQYTSLSSLNKGETHGRVFNGMKAIIQLVAYETGFAALSKDGSVWTWGDDRYTDALGREVTESSPANKPGMVEDLIDLPSGKIKKIAAAGYMTLALTEGHDLYAWGSHPGRLPVLESISGTPEPVMVEEHDIADFAVGETHVIVLTVNGDIYIVGENTNGQLGLPLERTTKWARISLPLVPGEVITGVKAGQRSSLILTEVRHSA